MDDLRSFVDANVPMYAVGAAHPLKEPCLRILDAGGRGALAAVTDSEVLQEILHRYTALGQRRWAAEVMELFVQAVPDVLAVTKADLADAASTLLEQDALRVRDAVHLAVMRRHGIRRIISADRHFDHLPDITRIDPLTWSA